MKIAYQEMGPKSGQYGLYYWGEKNTTSVQGKEPEFPLVLSHGYHLTILRNRTLHITNKTPECLFLCQKTM